MEGKNTENGINDKKSEKPGLYEIAAKIAEFCDNLDKSVKEGKK